VILITKEMIKFIHKGCENPVTDDHPSLNLRRYKEDLKKILENYKIEYQIINCDKIKNELSYYENLIAKDIIMFHRILKKNNMEYYTGC
jgi:hypothetical protein